jgi:REase_DpnII-MboI/Uncharacterized protein conserved in bacteria (DUF2321)
MVYSDSRPVAADHCSICGSQFVTECSECSAPLPSTFSSPIFFGSGKPVYPSDRPGACSNCGKVFPWTLKEPSQGPVSDIEAISLVCKYCSRFHLVARQLRNRHKNRETLNVEDEYDIQDLLHTLLRIHFDDIRREEWTPSYAGGAARVDFLIKPYGILLEVKKTRKGLAAKEIGKQLIEDIAKYKQASDCKTVICFIYDPEERIANPKGLISDLERLDRDIDIKGIVSPMAR